MTYAEEMCDIVVSHLGERVRFFVRADPETRSQEALYTREDVEWTDRRRQAVGAELRELLAKGAYEKQMDAGDVTQLIKVADEMVLFTGFIEEEVVVVSFERGILGDLPAVVGDFREYMQNNDVDFTALADPR